MSNDRHSHEMDSIFTDDYDAAAPSLIVPDEILTKLIFANVKDVKSKVACRRVCHQWCRCADDQRAWGKKCTFRLHMFSAMWQDQPNIRPRPTHFFKYDFGDEESATFGPYKNVTNQLTQYAQMLKFILVRMPNLAVVINIEPSPYEYCATTKVLEDTLTVLISLSTYSMVDALSICVGLAQRNIVFETFFFGRIIPLVHQLLHVAHSICDVRINAK